MHVHTYIVYGCCLEQCISVVFFANKINIFKLFECEQKADFVTAVKIRLYVHMTFIFSKRQRITLRLLYAMSRPSVCLSVCLSVCRLSVVCLSVTLVHPTQAVELFGNFFFTIR